MLGSVPAAEVGADAAHKDDRLIDSAEFFMLIWCVRVDGGEKSYTYLRPEEGSGFGVRR